MTLKNGCNKTHSRDVSEEKNAARTVMLQHGPRQTKADAADSPLTGEEMSPEKRGVRGNGTVVPLSRITEVQPEA